MKQFSPDLSKLLSTLKIMADRKWSKNVSTVTGEKLRTVRSWAFKGVPQRIINQYRLNVMPNPIDSTGRAPSPHDNAKGEPFIHPTPAAILEPLNASQAEIARLQTECARLDRIAAGHEGQAKAYRQAHNDLADRVAATLGRCEQLALDLRDSRAKRKDKP